jgi:hypothetical protein
MTEETHSKELDWFWWPSLEDLDDLTVENTEEGFLLSAPDGTLCSDWLAYWSESPEREAIFSREFQKVLLDHLKTLTENDGESTLTDRQENDRVDPQKVCTGPEQAD